MKEIKDAIEVIVAEEYERANNKFPFFNSNHEGIAVLEEEIVETGAEWNLVRHHFHELKIDVFTDNDIEQILDVSNIRERAVKTCAELIQVIAMCDKFMDSKAEIVRI